MAKEYTIDMLFESRTDQSSIGYSDTFSDAMDQAEAWCEDYDEQMFVGVWQGENLVAIFDSNDWFTK